MAPRAGLGGTLLRVRRLTIVLVLVGAALAWAAPALASDWLPHPTDATWTYEWSDSAYTDVPTKEKVTVKSVKGKAFVLAWTTEDEALGNPDEAVSSVGTVSFQETNSGLVNTDWSSNAPPATFPVLCANTTQCGNSLASIYYNVIWGSRSPTLPEPLLTGLSWPSSGGSGNDVTSSNRFLGFEQVTVPAFASPVTAAKVRSEITQTGALGDPYGSGIRTVWWVWGSAP